MTQPGQRRVEYMPLDDLPSAWRNPRRHNLPAIGRSMDEFGYVDLIVLDERTGRLVAGHGRRDTIKQARDGGQQPPEGVEIGADGRWLVPVMRGWASRDDRHAERFLVATNRVGELAGWDLDELVDILGDQDEADLPALGWNDDELSNMLAGAGRGGVGGDGEPDEDTDDGPVDPGTLLAAAGVVVGEPEIQTNTGQVWRLRRHHLVVVDVLTGWPTYTPLLAGDALLVPYPSLLAPHTEKAKRQPMVLVQPNTYLAGWLLTKWQAITGDTPQLVEADG